MCLGADVTRGINQKPFDGKIDYDFIMWIDSDILFTPQNVIALLNHDEDIVAGIYQMEGGKALATVKYWDEEFFKKNGYFQFMTLENIDDKKELFEVAYTGMGFMLVKVGVFESMEYPWFRPLEKKIGDMVDFAMEDVGFCLRAKERGYVTFVDPMVRVGHEKVAVL
jgi:hypothetical protein